MIISILAIYVLFSMSNKFILPNHFVVFSQFISSFLFTIIIKCSDYIEIFSIYWSTETQNKLFWPIVSEYRSTKIQNKPSWFWYLFILEKFPFLFVLLDCYRVNFLPIQTFERKKKFLWYGNVLVFDISFTQKELLFERFTFLGHKVINIKGGFRFSYLLFSMSNWFILRNHFDVFLRLFFIIIIKCSCWDIFLYTKWLID